MRSDNASIPSEQESQFQMAQDQIRLLIDKARKLHAGDSYTSVKALLGRPDIDEYTAKKESPRRTGRRLLYFVTKYEKPSTGKDRFVQLLFDATDRLERIDYIPQALYSLGSSPH